MLGECAGDAVMLEFPSLLPSPKTDMNVGNEAKSD